MSFDISILDKNVDLGEKVSGFDSLKDYEVRTSLLAEVVRSELMNLRSGNAHTKTRADVRGGGRKPWKQKGTGRARHGSRRSPIWVGGGVAWGPKNTVNWSLKINKSAKIAALKSVLKDRLNNKSVFQLDDKFNYPKTKEAVTILSKLAEKVNSNPKSAILIYTNDDKANLNGFPSSELKMINASNLKIHKLANASIFILTPKSKDLLESRVK
jgi:large subunit ribosomal protein L4